jgi:hypothetical protein
MTPAGSGSPAFRLEQSHVTGVATVRPARVPAPLRKKTMRTNDTNATPEQRRPPSVKPTAEKPEKADKESLAPTAVQPAGGKDESERPIVDPVTGAAL